MGTHSYTRSKRGSIFRTDTLSHTYTHSIIGSQVWIHFTFALIYSCTGLNNSPCVDNIRHFYFLAYICSTYDHWKYSHFQSYQKSLIKKKILLDWWFCTIQRAAFIEYMKRTSFFAQSLYSSIHRGIWYPLRSVQFMHFRYLWYLYTFKSPDTDQYMHWFL